MHMKQKRNPAPLLLLPTSTSPEVLQAVRDAGYVPIPTDEPDKVKLVLGCSAIGHNDFLMSALYGISGGTSTVERSKMVEELYRRLLKAEV